MTIAVKSNGNVWMRSGGGMLAKPDATLSIGVHNKTIQLDGSGSTPATVSMNTAASGSAVVLFTGGSFSDSAAPTDSKGNTLTKRGSDQGYGGGLWPDYGLRCYAAVSATGGSGHQASISKTTAILEISLVWVEVIGGGAVQAVNSGSAVPAGAGASLASPTITTTGQAILLAVASGDGPASTSDQTLTPSNGFTMVESSFLGNTGYVPIAVAYKYVASAGTYGLDWVPAADQGVSMMILAIGN